ncbi:universal stress protein [Streptomyces sp. TS71-3]|uniref:universal stress protein n=1 Tax=Streptomyces sp. TS71-3 TaxID=2733862 RepID=UPI001B0DB42C|nr:universal stress protein [Streptomyces sp. TS71-3]GHJ42319.1 hypothetical protein Sm713_79280 [Streptomyces sp. TS71-3]
MELPLVVGVDGSEYSLRAVDWATDEAARHGLALRLVHASLWQRYEHDGPAGRAPRAGGEGGPVTRAGEGGDAAGPGGPPGTAAGPGRLPGTEAGHAGTGTAVDPAGALEAPEERTVPVGSPERIVGQAADRAARRDPDVKVLTDVCCEEAEEALLRAARNATALVTGERGRGAVPGVLLGTVSLAMAAKAPCPVVVVRGSAAGRAGEHHRILLGVAEPASCAGAVRFAFREAEVRHSDLEALRAWRCPASQTAGRLRWPKERARRHRQRAARMLDEALRDTQREHPGTEVLRSVAEGPAHELLLEGSRTADLVVTGALRQSGHLGARIGRVAHTMLHYADCPVAVVPHRE